MTTTAADQALNALGRALGLAILIVAAAIAFAFAAAAALVVGLMILGAALALRLAPRAARGSAPGVLEAHATPTGWVVESGAKRQR